MDKRSSRKMRSEPEGSSESNNSSDQAPHADNVTRRRALIAGLAAAPVVLSLMNRSAWAQTTVSCNLVNSFVNANYQWQSPRPANDNGTLAFTEDQYKACDKQPPT